MKKRKEPKKINNIERWPKSKEIIYNFGWWKPKRKNSDDDNDEDDDDDDVDDDDMMTKTSMKRRPNEKIVKTKKRDLARCVDCVWVKLFSR